MDVSTKESRDTKTPLADDVKLWVLSLSFSTRNGEINRYNRLSDQNHYSQFWIQR